MQVRDGLYVCELCGTYAHTCLEAERHLCSNRQLCATCHHLRHYHVQGYCTCCTGAHAGPYYYCQEFKPSGLFKTQESTMPYELTMDKETALKLQDKAPVSTWECTECHWFYSWQDAIYHRCLEKQSMCFRNGSKFLQVNQRTQQVSILQESQGDLDLIPYNPLRDPDPDKSPLRRLDKVLVSSESIRKDEERLKKAEKERDDWEQACAATQAKLNLEREEHRHDCYLLGMKEEARANLWEENLDLREALEEQAHDMAVQEENLKQLQEAHRSVRVYDAQLIQHYRKPLDYCMCAGCLAGVQRSRHVLLKSLLLVMGLGAVWGAALWLA